MLQTKFHTHTKQQAKPEFGAVYFSHTQATNDNTEDAIGHSPILTLSKCRHAWDFYLLLSDAQTLRTHNVEKWSKQWTGWDTKGRHRGRLSKATEENHEDLSDRPKSNPSDIHTWCANIRPCSRRSEWRKLYWLSICSVFQAPAALYPSKEYPVKRG